MKHFFSVLFLLVVCFSLTAQQRDSTDVKPPETRTDTLVTPEARAVDDRVKKAGDSTSTPAQQRVVEQAQQQSQSSANEDTASSRPRIIYYQSTPEPKYDTRYRYKSRGGRGDIKTLAGSMHHSGGFGALSFRTTEFNDETMVLAGIRAGWIINRTLGIGVEGHGIIPTAKYGDIDPTRDVVALGGYGGMFLELIFFSNTVVHVTFPTSAGAGWIGYNEDWENPNPNPAMEESSMVDEDIFWYVEPGANIEVNIARNFRMAFGISQRFTQDLELVNTPNKAFEKTNYYITLKVGGF